MSDSLNPVIHRFIQDAGNVSQAFGFGRVVGQIYAYLYFSQEPHNLTDMQNDIGISKGSASTGVRQLDQWGAVSKVWIKGDRKDYYQANEWLGRVLKNLMSDVLSRRMGSYADLLNNIESDISELSDPSLNTDFLRQRVEKLRKFQKKIQQVWEDPLVRQILK